MKRAIHVTVNSTSQVSEVEPRLLLSDYLRHTLGFTGTHVGCEHGVCGACTVQVDDTPVRSCLMFAVQADGREVRTVEALAAAEEGEMHPLQEAFRAEHGLQCGFCTPGFLMSLEPELGTLNDLNEDELRERLSGNLCRCTGYQSIVSAVRAASCSLTCVDGARPDDHGGPTCHRTPGGKEDR